MRKYSLLFILFIGTCYSGYPWGFFGHKLINRTAVFILPPEMITFYKYHIIYLTENSVNPDRRRHAVKGEAPKHYIDIDVYGKDAVLTMPRKWEDAVAKYSEDTLQAYGIVPWTIERMKYRLTEAFKSKDAKAILRVSADLGHYIADSNVPLHTTVNYNGQMTNQKGIHGFWESRLPELFSNEYDLFVGRADYIDNPREVIWETIIQSHAAVDSVLGFERILTNTFPADKKFTIVRRGNLTIKTYSEEFSRAYHEMLNKQTERRMRSSVKLVGDLWYTCWVDAGQPDLSKLLDFQFSKRELEEMKKEKELWDDGSVETRPHEACAHPSEVPFRDHEEKKGSPATPKQLPVLGKAWLTELRPRRLSPPQPLV